MIVENLIAFDAADGGSSRVACFVGPEGAKLARVCLNAALDAGAWSVHLDRGICDSACVLRVHFRGAK